MLFIKAPKVLLSLSFSWLDLSLTLEKDQAPGMYCSQEYILSFYLLSPVPPSPNTCSYKFPYFFKSLVVPSIG